MAKEKSKHDGLLCFLLALIVVLILVIGGGAYYFLVVDNGEEIVESETENNFLISEQKNANEKMNERDEAIKELKKVLTDKEWIKNNLYIEENLAGTTSTGTKIIFEIIELGENKAPVVIILSETYDETTQQISFLRYVNNNIQFKKWEKQNSSHNGYELNNNILITKYGHMLNWMYKVYEINEKTETIIESNEGTIKDYENYTELDNITKKYFTKVFDNTSDDTKILHDENLNKYLLKEKKDYLLLYNGFEMIHNTGIQFAEDMEKTNENMTKYNTTYYNYENGKYVGETKGTFGEETFYNHSMVSNVSRVAISKKYNAIPRKYTEITELPKQLKNNNYTSTQMHSIDLDNDGKNENILCWKIDYKKVNAENKEIQASSGIVLMDSNYNKINDLVTLENGFWANIKEEERKQFLSLEKVEYIDIDEDGIMEIIIEVPVYEGTQLSVVKYNKGKIDGNVNYKASLQP